MPVQNHRHTWLWWDWGKIDYNNLLNKPATSADRFIVRDTTWESTYSAWTFKIVTWFRPSEIRIESSRAVVNDDPVSFGDCFIAADWTKTTVTTYFDGSLNSWQINSTNIILVKPSTTSTVATVWTIYDDWFDLVFPNNNHNLNVKIIAKW